MGICFFSCWINSVHYCLDNITSVHFVLYSTILYLSVLCSTVLYCTVLYCTVLYCTVVYSTIMYCTVLLYIHNEILPDNRAFSMLKSSSLRDLCYIELLHHI